MQCLVPRLAIQSCASPTSGGRRRVVVEVVVLMRRVNSRGERGERQTRAGKDGRPGPYPGTGVGRKKKESNAVLSAPVAA